MNNSALSANNGKCYRRRGAIADYESVQPVITILHTLHVREPTQYSTFSQAP
jgi:hypothetical protein